MEDVLSYIDDHLGETIDRLISFCALPSVAAQGVGMADMAELVRATFQAAGGSAQLVPTAGYPVVLARFPGHAARTLMFYNHYDVQPPEPLELWDSPPFEPHIRDGHLYARGVADNKGNLVARLAAIEAWLAVRGELPVNVLFVAEGEEEIGSPNLGPFAESHQSELQADGC
ncbi:MAG TPA: M20/M25/M40 family metallo-hydrolase, partial [Halothiobacillaceae bacterium]|nr:M20/M25/M40 family metallo-hydrolase [Halothiobacillaceae bacterium]